MAAVLSTPGRVPQKNKEEDNPDSEFLEKMYLFEQFIAFVDFLGESFVKVRFFGNWNTEEKELQEWIAQGE